MSVLCETLSHKDSAHIILKNGSLGVEDYEAGIQLHQIGKYVSSRFASAACAKNDDIQIESVDSRI